MTTPPTDPHRDPRPNQTLTVEAFQALIAKRYLPTDAARGVPGTFMWFIEEVGELATALHETDPARDPTPAQIANLGEEFADVFAWMLTLANIRGIDLATELTKYTDPDRVKGTKP